MQVMRHLFFILQLLCAVLLQEKLCVLPTLHSLRLCLGFPVPSPVELSKHNLCGSAGVDHHLSIDSWRKLFSF
jgi:hypothetical protein